MPPKATKSLTERNLPTIKNHSMLNETDPTVLSSKCRVQDVRFGGPLEEGVTETFVRIKTLLPPGNSPHFIMRKAADNYVSATSMFRAVFPDAPQKQEKQEMEIIRRELAARQDVNASGVWIPGTPDALQLAEVYGIKPWVQALLDAPTTKAAYPDDRKSPSSAHTPAKKEASSTRKEASSVSPTKKATRERSASPRKSAVSVVATARKAKKAAKEATETITEDVNDVTEAIKASVKPVVNGMKITDLLESVTETVENAVSAVRSTVEDTLPLSATITNTGQSMAEMMEQARTQVADAISKDSAALTKSGLPRKTPKKRALEEEDSVVSIKRSRVESLEIEVVKEKRKVRALFGLVIGLGATAILPYVL